MSKVRYKYCVVPDCKSTTTKTPSKLFFSIPTGDLRKKWCEVMGRDSANCKPLSAKCNRFCCEDHFDLEQDMENYRQWQLVGSKKLILKKGVLPHKFDCQQPKSDGETTENTNTAKQKQRMSKSKGNTKRVPNKKRKKKNDTQNLYVKAISPIIEEKDKIDQQIKLLQKISQLPQETKTSPQQPDEVEKYTFQIKVEADDDAGLGSTIIEEYEIHNFEPINPDDGKIGDIEVKVEELDEEFEPIVVENKPETISISENISNEGKTEIETFMVLYDSDHSTEFVIEQCDSILKQ